MEREAPAVPMPEPVREAGTKRYDDAVVFYAAAARPNPPDDDGLSPVVPAWFMPVVCVKRKVIRFGVACADVVPTRATVRTTGARVLVLVRGGGFESQPEDGKKLVRPRAPACCMYNGCFGETVPFTPVGGALIAARPQIAVWPADADVGLIVPTLDIDSAVASDGGPSSAASGGDGALLQAFEVRGRRYLTTSAEGRSLSGTYLLRKDPTGLWSAVGERLFGASRAVAIHAVTDVDGDGKNEIFAYGAWANDHSFGLFVDDRRDSPFDYSCGNI